MEEDIGEPLSNEQVESIVESVARKIVDRRLEAPAVLFLEMHKPLTFLASQAAYVAMPFLSPILGVQRMADFARVIQDRANIDLLISRIEDISAEAGASAPAQQE